VPAALDETTSLVREREARITSAEIPKLIQTAH
jgi:hypothetical protein